MIQKTVAAIVVQAEAETLRSIKELSKRLEPFYQAALESRRKANEASLQIGKAIIEGGTDPEIVGKIAALNSKANKPNGGTPTRAHSWLSEEIARATGYSASYLKQCCALYISEANKALNEIKGEQDTGTIRYEGGQIALPLVLPNPACLATAMQIAAPKCEPSSDESGDGSEETPDTAKAIEDYSNRLAAMFRKAFDKDKGGIANNVAARRKVMNKVNEEIEQYGFSLVPLK